jgi:hypothetical protein
MSWLPEEFQALQKAAADGDLDRVRSLLDGGVDQNTHPGMPRGWSPLMHAAHAGHLAVVRELVERGANIAFACGDHFTALALAAGDGHWEVVKLLASYGAEIHQENVYDNAGGWTTALGMAKKSRRRSLVKELLAAADARKFA